jgi:hypothetical protein
MLYTDPGSGALLWQVLAAGAVGAMFYIRKLSMFFRGKSNQPSSDSTELKDPTTGNS